MVGLYFFIAMLASHNISGQGDLSSMDTNIKTMPAVRPEIVFEQTLYFKYSCPEDDPCENSVPEEVGRKALKDEFALQIKKSWLCESERDSKQPICSLKVNILHYDICPHKNDYQDDSCKTRYCLEMTATYTFDLIATNKKFRDYDPALARMITNTELLMNSFKEHLHLTLWVRQTDFTGRPMMFYLTSASSPQTVAEHGHIVKVDRTGRGYIFLKDKQNKCTTEGYMPIENEDQCHEAANSLSKKRRHPKNANAKKDNFGRHQSLKHRRGCFVNEGNVVTFYDYDNCEGSEYVVHGYGREICHIDAPAKTTASRIPRTTKTSYKAIDSFTSVTAEPSTKAIFTSIEARLSSTKVTVTSTKATAPSTKATAPSTKATAPSTKATVPPATVSVSSTTFSVSSTNRSAFSEKCRICIAVCHAHCKLCDARDVEIACRPCASWCPANETAAALEPSKNVLSLSSDATVIVISSSCALVAIVIVIALVVQAWRSSFSNLSRIMHFESDVVNGVEVRNNSRPSFDADEDWSVGMVMDEMHIKMTESPLHRMIRKQRGRSTSCGSEDMGRERQQFDQPELIPSYDSQSNGCQGTNDYPEETPNKTYSSFDSLDQERRTHYGSFDNNDEELRMDVDGRWYTRMEFQVEYGGLLQWDAAPRVGDVEDSEENDEVAILPSPPSTLDQREADVPAHSDNTDEEQSDPGDTVSAKHTVTADVKDDRSAPVNTRMVGKVLIGPASRNKKNRVVPKAKSDDALDKQKYACNDPKASLNTRIKVASPKGDKYAVDKSSAVVIASTHKRDGDREDKYEVPVTLKDGTIFGTRTTNEVVGGRGTRSEKQITEARKAYSDNARDESKYTSNTPRTSLKTKIHTAPTKQDKYAVDVSSAIVVSSCAVNEVVSNLGRRSKKQMPAAPKAKSADAMDKANESKYASTDPHTLLKARLQVARSKEDKYTVDVSSAPVISGSTGNKVVASASASSKKQMPTSPCCKSETKGSKYVSNAPQTLLKARLQAARPKKDKYTVDVSSAPVISAGAVEKVLSEKKPKKQTPASEVHSESNGSKYASKPPQTLLQVKLQAAQPKQDKYTVDVSSASLLTVHKQDGDRESDTLTTPAAAPPLTKESSSKRMRRQQTPNSKRQSRRSRHKRNSHDDDVSSQVDQASSGATSDRYTIPKTEKIKVGRARKQPDANTSKYATEISVNRKVLTGTAQKKDRYHVDTLKRPSRDNKSKDRINKNKYTAAAPVTGMKAIAASTQNAAKNQYTVDTRKVMPAVKAVNSVLEKREEYAVDTLPAKACPAHQHRPSESGAKAVVVTNSPNDARVLPTSGTTAPTVDAHPLVPKVTKAAMIETNDRYAVEATPVLAHKKAVKPSNDDSKYIVPSSRLKTATPNRIARDKATAEVRIKVDRELSGQKNKKVLSSGDNSGDKYAVSTSNKVKSMTKSKVARNTAQERTEKKNLDGKDVREDQATCKPVHANSKKSDADKNAVEVDDKLASTIDTKAPVASKRALRRQRLRMLKLRRERRRRDRERLSRSSQDVSSDKNNQTNERIVGEDSDKLDKGDSKSEIISVADETAEKPV